MPEMQEASPNGTVASTIREGTKLGSSIASMSASQAITLVFVLAIVFIGIIAAGALYELKEVMIRAEKRADEREAEGYRWQGDQAERNRKMTMEESERNRKLMMDERAKDRQVVSENTSTLKKLEAAFVDNTAVLKKLEAAIVKKGGGIMDP